MKKCPLLIVVLVWLCVFNAKPQANIPSVVFIVDNSGSISSSEFNDMQSCIFDLTTDILTIIPNSELAVMQYAGDSGYDYDITVTFTNNVGTLTSWNRAFPYSMACADDLPGALANARDNNVWETQLDLNNRCVLFVLFTDGWRSYSSPGDFSILCHVPGVGDYTGAYNDGYGEYNYLKTNYDAKWAVVHCGGADYPNSYEACAAIASVGGPYSDMIDTYASNPVDPEGTGTLPRYFFPTTNFSISSSDINDLLIYVEINCSVFDINLTSTPPLCYGECDATATVTVTAGQPPYIYSWDNGETTSTITGLCGGDTYYVTVTDDDGLSATGSITVDDDPPQVVVSITGTNPSCTGYCDATATATASGGTGTLSYLWDHNAGTAPDASGLCGDSTYTVTVTDENNCTATASYTPVDPPGVILDVTGTDPSCTGYCDATATSTASGGTGTLSYQWDNSAGTAPDATDLCGGITYTLVVTDVNGCTVSDSHTPVDPPLLILSVTGTDPSCYGVCDATATSTASGGTGTLSYQWDNSAGTAHDATDLCGGTTYTLVVTDMNGCTVSDSHTPVDPPPIIINDPVVTDVTCYGYNDGAITVTASSGTGTLNYSIPGETNQNGIFTGLGADTYTVTVTDQNGCTNTIQAVITEPPQLVLTITSDIVCIDEMTSVTVYATGGTPPYSYQWSNFETTQSITDIPGVTTNYSVVVTDANNCVENISTTVIVYPPLAINIYPDDTICEGDQVTIYANYSGGMGEPYTLTLNGSTTIQTPYTVSPTVTTVYEVCVDDDCPTPQVCDDLEIVVMPDPPVNFVADIYDGCEPLTVNFSEISQHTGQTYQWNFGDPWGSTTGTGKNPVHAFENPGAYDVTCTVTSEYGCTNTWTWYEMIWVWPNPVAAFYPYPQVATILEPYVYFENNSSTFYITNWTFGDGDSSNVVHPQHKYDGCGTYNVMLAVETEHGCVDTTWSEVVIQDIITFYAPTAFSPDYDQMNALFSPIGHGIDPDYWHLMIYDRWGEKVWETYIYDVDEETGEVHHGWDGTVRDKKMGENAVYSWLVIYRDDTGAEHQRAGLVTLVR